MEIRKIIMKKWFKLMWVAFAAVFIFMGIMTQIPSSQTVVLDRPRSIVELSAQLGTSTNIESLEVVFDENGRESFILVPPVRSADNVVAQYRDAYSRHAPMIRGLLQAGMSSNDEDAAYNAARAREIERLEARMDLEAEDLYVSRIHLHGPPSEIASFRAWLALAEKE